MRGVSTGTTDIHSYIRKSRIIGIYFRIKRLWHCLNLFTSRHQIFTARKRSLGQGNIFTGVCLSRGGLCMMSLPVWLSGPIFLLWGLQGVSVSSEVSVQEGSLSRRSLSRRVSVQGGLCPGGSPWQNPAPRQRLPLSGEERSVRILLECFLVTEYIYDNLNFRKFCWSWTMPHCFSLLNGWPCKVYPITFGYPVEIWLRIWSTST